MEIVLSKSNVYGRELQCFNDYIYKNAIQRNILWDEEVVDEILENITDNSEVLDIGANIGLIPLGILFKNPNKNINIHCFECDPKIIPLLRFNTSSYNNIKLYPFALSNTQELCQITSLETNMGCNYIYSSADATSVKEYDYSSIIDTNAHIKNRNTYVLGIALDSIKYQFKSKISVIKIDVEGYEIKVLEGAREIITTHKPIIIIEIWDQLHLDGVLDFFRSVNYGRYRKLEGKIYRSQDYIFYPN